MRRMWMGMTTAALLLGSAGTALANQQGQQSKSTMGKEEQKQSSEKEKMGQAGAHELTGKVVSIKGDTLYLRKYDAVIPVKVQSSTELEGKPLAKSQSVSSQLKSEFREGEQVRTSFNIQDNTDNVATSISKVGEHKSGSSEKSSQQQKSTTPSE